MTLQTKVTLGSVMLATVTVTLVSAVDLASIMQIELDATLERAGLIRDVAMQRVIETLNRRREVSSREALADPELQSQLVKLLVTRNSVFSIDVVSHPGNQVLASSLPNRIGAPANAPEFGELVTKGSWLTKLQVMLTPEHRYYMVKDTVGSDSGNKFDVQVVIHPTFSNPSIKDTLYQQGEVAILSVAGAVLLTLLLSAAVFRGLGHIGQMLDRVASGQYEPELLALGEPNDELAVITSKVNLLGERLRGAQFEVSDLRGNIDHLLHDLEDAVIIFNREFRLVFATGSVERFLGRDRGELTGEQVAVVFPPTTMVGLMVAQAIQTGRGLRNRRVPQGLGGMAFTGPPTVLLSVDILESLPGGRGEGNGILVRLRDPEAERKINRELKTADRLSAISRISSGVAHEVKNPLNAILLHVEVARSKLSRGDTAVEEQMEIIAGEILRLDRVVRTFLDFTRPVELQLDNVPVGELVREIVELARPQTSAAKIEITVRQECDGAEVRVDRDLLKQAMLNVVVNAMQAMPEGGELHFDALVKQDTAELRITDTGGGIPSELRDKIFRLYFTTKTNGSGIGLAMTFRIVQLHDGTIDFTSEPGKGTTFLIRLPIAV